MLRTARATPGGNCCHVLNRGNRRAEVFHADADYNAFVGLLADAAWVPCFRGQARSKCFTKDSLAAKACPPPNSRHEYDQLPAAVMLSRPSHPWPNGFGFGGPRKHGTQQEKLPAETMPFRRGHG